MNKKLIPSLHKIVFIIIVSTLVLACKKDHNVLGVDVQPAEDALNAEFIGDLAVTAHTLKFDSIVTFSDSVDGKEIRNARDKLRDMTPGADVYRFDVTSNKTS